MNARTVIGVAIMGTLLVGTPLVIAGHKAKLQMVDAQLTYSPEVPAPITRKTPAVVRVRLDSGMKVMPLSGDTTYTFWTFNDRVPGPFIRARVGDTLEVHVTNSDESGMPHNVDFHAVTGPGGGATVTTVTQGADNLYHIFVCRELIQRDATRLSMILVMELLMGRLHHSSLI